MILSTRVLAATALTTMIALAGCSSKDKKNEAAAAPAPPTAHEQAVSQLQVDRDAYVQRIDAKVTRYQQHAENLRARSAAQTKPMNKKLSNAAEDLEASLRDVKHALDEVKASAPSNWIDYKRDVEKSISRADMQVEQSTSLLQ